VINRVVPTAIVISAAAQGFAGVTGISFEGRVGAGAGFFDTDLDQFVDATNFNSFFADQAGLFASDGTSGGVIGASFSGGSGVDANVFGARATGDDVFIEVTAFADAQINVSDAGAPIRDVDVAGTVDGSVGFFLEEAYFVTLRGDFARNGSFEVVQLGPGFHSFEFFTTAGVSIDDPVVGSFSASNSFQGSLAFTTVPMPAYLSPVALGIVIGGTRRRRIA